MEQLRLIEINDERYRSKGQQFIFEPDNKGFRIQYEHPNGQLYQGDSIDWLSSLKAGSVDLVFADPPYNLKKADWDNFESQEKYIEWSVKWISQASQVQDRGDAVNLLTSFILWAPFFLPCPRISL